MRGVQAGCCTSNAAFEMGGVCEASDQFPLVEYLRLDIGQGGEEIGEAGASLTVRGPRDRAVGLPSCSEPMEQLQFSQPCLMVGGSLGPSGEAPAMHHAEGISGI